MAYVIPNEMPTAQILAKLYARWKPEAQKAVHDAIIAFSPNLETAEDLRLTMIASPGKGGEARPTMWIPLCKHVNDAAKVFDSIAQHTLKIKLMDKAAINTATPTVGTADAGAAETSHGASQANPSPARVNVSLQDLCSLLQGAQDACVAVLNCCCRHALPLHFLSSLCHTVILMAVILMAAALMAVILMAVILMAACGQETITTRQHC